MPEPEDPLTAGRLSRADSPVEPRTRRLSPAADEAIKNARQLRAPQGRRKLGQFLVEGVRLVGDALSQGVEPDTVFVTHHLLHATPRGRALSERLRAEDAPIYEVSERHLTLVADTEAPAGVVIVARLPPNTGPLPLPKYDGVEVLLLDQVRDPGNIGGILRTAAAAGVRDVVSTEGSADLWAPKVVRAGAGAHFRLWLHTSRGIDELSEWLLQWPQRVVADARATQSIYQVNWKPPTVLIVSNEAHGASSWLSHLGVTRAAIPMQSETESLNVAAATAVLLFEARRPD